MVEFLSVPHRPAPPVGPLYNSHRSRFQGAVVMSDFVLDVKNIRERAHKHVEDGAVTGGNKANRKRVIDVLNDALATELVCILRYKRHFYMARGMNAESVKAEFLQHAI